MIYVVAHPKTLSIELAFNSTIMQLHVLKLRLDLDSDLSQKDARKIRNYLGRLFKDDSYAHNHLDDGKFIYRYPRVQYKVINNHCFIVGFNEGNNVIKQVFDELRILNLEGKWQEILSKSLDSKIYHFGISQNPTSYRFLTPWLALNEKNYQKYRQQQSLDLRKTLLESILIGNILSLSKSLGYTVSDPIKAEIKFIREVPAKLKGVGMTAFMGRFSVNFEIPDLFGIGKSVSRGFGTIKRCQDPTIR